MERKFWIVSWARFADFVTMRFGPPIRSNALGELKELRHTSSGGVRAAISGPALLL
jgi:hypothetical protein